MTSDEFEDLAKFLSFLKEKYPDPSSPKIIAQNIGLDENNVKAIAENALLNRWVNLVLRTRAELVIKINRAGNNKLNRLTDKEESLPSENITNINVRGENINIGTNNTITKGNDEPTSSNWKKNLIIGITVAIILAGVGMWWTSYTAEINQETTTIEDSNVNQGSGNQMNFAESIIINSTINQGMSSEEFQKTLAKVLEDISKDGSESRISRIEPFETITITPIASDLMIMGLITEDQIYDAYRNYDEVDFVGTYHIVKKIIYDDYAILLMIDGQKGTVPFLVFPFIIHSDFIQSSVKETPPMIMLQRFLTAFGDGELIVDYKKRVLDIGTFYHDKYLKSLSQYDYYEKAFPSFYETVVKDALAKGEITKEEYDWLMDESTMKNKFQKILKQVP